ncbi:MAG TPA: RDD family protein [Acidimicrobiales bacterium]|nr:RDD family protein [Acidimicrobiales bacterium]
MSCQFCAQVSGMPSGVRLSSVGKRFGGYVLESILIGVTLLIGWLVWSLIVWKDGQTPAKQMLGMRVLKLQTGTKATWGTMFVREIIGKTIGGIAGFFTFGILTFMLLWDRNNQEVWDKVAGSIVVDDAHKRLI